VYAAAMEIWAPILAENGKIVYADKEVVCSEELWYSLSP
jgi:hypothetical protein